MSLFFFSDLLSLTFLRPSPNLGLLPFHSLYIAPWPGRSNKNQKWTKCNLEVFCVKIPTTFLTFLLKIQNSHTHYPRIIVLLRSLPPSASSCHSWRGRGYLFWNFALFNLTFRTCNLEVFCPFQNLSNKKPEIFTFKLQGRKMRLRRTNL